MGRADPLRPSLPRKPRAPPSPTHPRPHLARRTGLKRVVGCGTDGRDAGAGHAGFAERAETEFFFFVTRRRWRRAGEPFPTSSASLSSRPAIALFSAPTHPRVAQHVYPPTVRALCYFGEPKGRGGLTHTKKEGDTLSTSLPPFFFSLTHTPHQTITSRPRKERKGKSARTHTQKEDTHAHTHASNPPPLPSHHTKKGIPQKKDREHARSRARVRRAHTTDATSFLTTFSYTSRILRPTTVWNRPVPLLEPGKVAFFSICCVISP